MARVLGKDISAVSLNSQSLLSDTISLNWKHSADVVDDTAYGDNDKLFVGGLKGGDDVTHEMFFNDTTTTGTWAFLTNLIGAAATTFTFTAGARTVSVSAIVKDVSMPMPIADRLKFTATYRMSGAVTYS